MRLQPYGDRALFVDLELADEKGRAERTHGLARALRERLPEADVVVGCGTIVITEYPLRADLARVVRETLGLSVPSASASREHRVRVRYDGADLAEVAERTGLTPREIAEVHAAGDYLVELTGFLPGFAYLLGVDERLRLPRRATPRPRVRAGSVGVAGAHTGVYPFDSPGGWLLLGTALDFKPFDATRDPAIALAPGDRVRFEIAHVDA